jgi:hypothetical protein
MLMKPLLYFDVVDNEIVGFCQMKVANCWCVWTLMGCKFEVIQ